MLSQKHRHMRTAFKVKYYSTLTYRILTFFTTHFVKHWTSVPVCAFFFMSFVNTRLSDHTWSSCLNSERVRWPFFVEIQRDQHTISSKESQQPILATNIGGISNILQHNHRNLAQKIKALPFTHTFNKTYIKICQSPTILPANGGRGTCAGWKESSEGVKALEATQTWGNTWRNTSPWMSQAGDLNRRQLKRDSPPRPLLAEGRCEPSDQR